MSGKRKRKNSNVAASKRPRGDTRTDADKPLDSTNNPNHIQNGHHTAFNSGHVTIQQQEPNNLPSPPSSDSKEREADPPPADSSAERHSTQSLDVQYSQVNALLAQAHVLRMQRHPRPPQPHPVPKQPDTPLIPHDSYDHVNSVLQQLHRQRRTGPEWQEEPDEEMDWS